MTDKKEPTKAGSTELKEEELDTAVGAGVPRGKIEPQFPTINDNDVKPKTTNFSFGVE